MIPMLLEKGATEIRLYDPLALEHTRIAFNPKHNKEYSKISFHESSIDALKDSDVAIIATDHNEFKTLAQQLIDTTIKPYLIIDGRKIIPIVDILKLLDNKISYLSVAGRFLKYK
jgi:UDP-glucose 6-dehydrogenase